MKDSIAICSINGKTRTGKSYLMNQLLSLEPNKGFKISKSVDPCTKGLWIWS